MNTCRKSLLPLSVILLFCHVLVGTGSGKGPVDLVFADYDKLIERKEQIRLKQPAAMSSVEFLIKKADRALNDEIVTVMDKTHTAPSGDKHDYLSLAPYWWPDSNKADGLPYIRHDGKVNPKTRGRHVDCPAKNQFFKTVETLGMAGFYSGDSRYKQRAIEWLEAWFANPETRMNPSLEYAQGIPGRNDGRCFGIIELCDIDKVITNYAAMIIALRFLCRFYFCLDLF